MKFIHVFLMLALIAGGYFIRDVVEPTKEAQADVAGMDGDQLYADQEFRNAVTYIVHNHCQWGSTQTGFTNKTYVNCYSGKSDR
jgi:hypothetical protein